MSIVIIFIENVVCTTYLSLVIMVITSIDTAENEISTYYDISITFPYIRYIIES